MITRNRPSAVLWRSIFSTPSPPAQMFHSAAAIARCSKVVRRVRKTKAAAQILPQCVNCITCILHIRCLIIYCIKLPRCGYVLLSIKYTCKHHLKWVRRTKKNTMTKLSNSCCQFTLIGQILFNIRVFASSTNIF